MPDFFLKITRKIKRIKKLHIVIVSVVILLFAYNYLFPWLSSKVFWTKQKQEAIKRFNETRLTALSHKEAQELIDAITGEKDWIITYDSVVFKETGYLDNPYIAVETYLFKNKDNSKKILKDKLYLYDEDSFNWIPISEQENLVIEKKIVHSDKTDIWSEGNNWIKTYSKGKIIEDSLWNKCTNMVFSEGFDIETDLPENHECYFVQQDFQEILSY